MNLPQKVMSFLLKQLAIEVFIKKVDNYKKIQSSIHFYHPKEGNQFKKKNRWFFNQERRGSVNNNPK